MGALAGLWWRVGRCHRHPRTLPVHGALLCRKTCADPGVGDSGEDGLASKSASIAHQFDEGKQSHPTPSSNLMVGHSSLRICTVGAPSQPLVCVAMCRRPGGPTCRGHPVQEGYHPGREGPRGGPCARAQPIVSMIRKRPKNAPNRFRSDDPHLIMARLNYESDALPTELWRQQ